ncbi:hypothetical protein ACNQVK_21565 [Mycobacterium sp. 134]
MVGDVWRAQAWGGGLGCLFGPSGWSENTDLATTVERSEQKPSVQSAMT